MTKEQKLLEECLYWLVEFQATTTELNDDAWESLGDLIDRCCDAIKQE